MFLLHSIARRLQTAFGHLEVIICLLISFMTMSVLMGRQHKQLSGADMFTGQGRDLIDARYWGINHVGPWNTKEFSAWFSLYSQDEKQEYIIHNLVAIGNVIQLNGVLLGLASLLIPISSPFWWVLLLSPLAFVVKLLEVLCIHLLIQHEMSIALLDPTIHTMVGLTGGVLAALKIYIPPMTILLLLLALLYQIVISNDIVLNQQKAAIQPTGPSFSTKSVPQSALIAGTFAVASLSAILHLCYEHPQEETAYADGPIMAVGLVWYILSNYLCANAAYLYPKYLPTPVKIMCWLGLIGGGVDHIMETWQWWNDDHKQFGAHWMGMEMIPLLLFALTSIVGIVGVVLEWVMRDQNASCPVKFVVLSVLALGIYYETIISFSLNESTVRWHLGHIFITHILLSMMPPMLVWIYAPELNLFTLLPNKGSKIKIS